MKTHANDNGRPSRRAPVKTTRPAAALLVALVAAALLAADAAEKKSGTAFADMSLEELMNESVTSVSKKETRLSASPAAIAVLNAEDFRLWNFATLPEALRLVPGMDIARVNASQWAVSARGFNDLYAHKLLVLVDGRNVYTPSFGGVVWFAQGVATDDLDRIEVIRGPGATLWGANAVNGVVNVISKPARETQGGLLSATVGSEEQLTATLRHGGTLGANAHYRVYVKSFERDGLVDRTGRQLAESWDGQRAGFRSDWQPASGTAVTVQGDLYRVNVGEELRTFSYTVPFARIAPVRHENKGGNVLGRWTRQFGPDSQVSLQAYYDHFHNWLGPVEEVRDTYDVEFQHRFPLGPRHDVMWGIGYRVSADTISGMETFVWSPAQRTLSQLSGFVQDEIAIMPRRLALTLGTKIERNDYTGLEVQPGIRLAWTPTDRQTVWAAASRAVSTPSRFQRDARLVLSASQASPFSPLVVIELQGTPTVGAERQDAFEAGYRVEPSSRLSLDLATFYSRHNRVGNSVSGPTAFDPRVTPPRLTIPLRRRNDVTGHSYGAEFAVQWRPAERWRFAASYTLLRMHLEGDSATPRASPRHQASLRTQVRVARGVDLVGAGYYVAALDPGFNGTTAHMPRYIRLDAGLVWRTTESLELGLWGRNLADPRHPEFSSNISVTLSEVPRSFDLRATWRF